VVHLAGQVPPGGRHQRLEVILADGGTVPTDVMAAGVWVRQGWGLCSGGASDLDTPVVVNHPRLVPDAGRFSLVGLTPELAGVLAAVAAAFIALLGVLVKGAADSKLAARQLEVQRELAVEQLRAQRELAHEQMQVQQQQMAAQRELAVSQLETQERIAEAGRVEARALALLDTRRAAYAEVIAAGLAAREAEFIHRLRLSRRPETSEQSLAEARAACEDKFADLIHAVDSLRLIATPAVMTVANHTSRLAQGARERLFLGEDASVVGDDLLKGTPFSASLLHLRDACSNDVNAVSV